VCLFWKLKAQDLLSAGYWDILKKNEKKVCFAAQRGIKS
jgi:hypothetical protein